MTTAHNKEIVLAPKGSRSGQLIYTDETQEHVVRCEMAYGQKYVYRHMGKFIDCDSSQEELYERNNLKEL